MRFVFPDNTVLCNYAAVHRLDLLERVLRRRGRWTEAVAYEAHRSSRHLPDLASIAGHGWLGEPIEVTDQTEMRSIERLRRAVFGGAPDAPLKHLGEAQTCFLIQTRDELKNAVWVSDDQESVRYAARQGLATRETIDLLREAVRTGGVTAENAHALLRAMADEGRRLRVSTSADELVRDDRSFGQLTR